MDTHPPGDQSNRQSNRQSIPDSSEPSTNYLAELTLAIAGGITQFPIAWSQPHIDFLLRQQQPDGGFAGREGRSDPYYTSFGVRSLAVLGALAGEPAERAASFLRGCLSKHESVIDLLALIYASEMLRILVDIDIMSEASADWKDRVCQTLLALRRPDGGFARTAAGHASSTYQTFLVIVCLQLIGFDLPNPDQAREFLLNQAVTEGGFREVRVSKRAGTNPTAAAVAALKILSGMDAPPKKTPTIRFLGSMQNEEGGMLANTRIPIADILSTFTGLVALRDLQSLDMIDCRAMANYATSLSCATGGFLAAQWDHTADVEYTFYGLGTLSLLQDSTADG